MNNKEKLAFAVVAALAMTSGGFAFGQSVNNVSSDQVIYACVTGVNGNITKVSNTPKTCPKGTSPISWNMVGPKGDQGIRGLQGDKGNQGERGGAEFSTKPTSFMVSPAGDKYPIYLGKTLNESVYIDGLELPVVGNPTETPHIVRGFELWEGFQVGPFYATNNCSGSKLGFIDDVRYSKFILPGVIYRASDSSGPRNFFVKQADAKASQILSWSTTRGCESIALGEDGTVFEEIEVSLDDYSTYSYLVEYPRLN